MSQSRKRGPFDHNNAPPAGQAGYWYEAVLNDPDVPLSGILVARQIARLCGDDSKVTLPIRSLADAVGRSNRAGHTVSYAERGRDALVVFGWLAVETVGQKRGARTTYYLMPGDMSDGYTASRDMADLVQLVA